MNLISFRGHLFYIGLIIVVSFLMYLYIHKYLLELYFSFFSFGSYLYSLALKLLFHEARPTTADIPKIAADIYSFPSSHVVFYTVTFGFFLYITKHIHHMDKLLKYSLKVLFIYLIVLVGISRLILGQHWLQDVLFGYIFGLIYLLIEVNIYKRISNTK
jgi:membrane-associated phospholipid phosphatase